MMFKPGQTDAVDTKQHVNWHRHWTCATAKNNKNITCTWPVFSQSKMQANTGLNEWGMGNSLTAFANKQWHYANTSCAQHLPQTLAVLHTVQETSHIKHMTWVETKKQNTIAAFDPMPSDSRQLLYWLEWQQPLINTRQKVCASCKHKLNGFQRFFRNSSRKIATLFPQLLLRSCKIGIGQRAKISSVTSCCNPWSIKVWRILHRFNIVEALFNGGSGCSSTK